MMQTRRHPRWPVMLAGGILLATSTVPALGEGQPEPRAVLADVSGTVWIHASGAAEPERAGLGRRLRVGDEVHTEPGATASIFLAGGQILEVLGGSRVRITRDLAAGPDGARQLVALSASSLKILEEGVWVLSDPRGSILVSPMRGDEEALAGTPEGARLLSPIQELVPRTRPTFYWRGAPEEIVVAVGKEGEAIWRSAPTRGPSLRYPAGAPPLAAGTPYEWWLESAADGARLTSRAWFRVASSRQAEEVARFEAQMAELERTATQALAGFLRCAYYEELGAWSDLLATAETLSDDEAADLAGRMQRIARRRMGLDPSAAELLLGLRRKEVP